MNTFTVIDFYYFSFLFLLNLIILLNFKKFSNLINIYDFPDNFRKIHKSKVSLSGGLILYVNLLLFLIYLFFFKNNTFFQLKIFEIKQLFFFTFISTSIFLIGFYDDKFNVSFEKRLILLFLFIFIFLNYNPQINITNIIIEQLYIKLEINKISVLMVALIVLSYMISLNLFDGINMQSLGYFFVILMVLIYKKIFVLLNITFLIPIIFLIYLNYKNKIFIGDGGIYLLGFILSYNFIFGYQSTALSGEIILIMVIMPITDAIRVAFARILKGINPSIPGNEHLHHILLNYFNPTLVFFIILLSYIVPILILLIYNSLLVFSLCIFLISYILLVNFRYVKKL